MQANHHKNDLKRRLDSLNHLFNSHFPTQQWSRNSVNHSQTSLTKPTSDSFSYADPYQTVSLKNKYCFMNNKSSQNEHSTKVSSVKRDSNIKHIRKEIY
mmetsp:Transcript_23517/g.23191  ORF Transcript_23517/g.23191 Transcript_23517/m.23191 type:complete len:99 (-) Transcript_23517:1366-1662(-)